mmetsp:Transcript_75910/g.214675  ORF Transcript_75910/g.214675 Transcript_75910/m.214675 type:complete len:480 (+) Transcript_75910:99-1538(+)
MGSTSSVSPGSPAAPQASTPQASPEKGGDDSPAARAQKGAAEGANPWGSLAKNDVGKPYFFLASCPESQCRDATRLAQKYGGFFCVSEGGGGAGDSFMTCQDGRFVAWKGKVEGQFLTLKGMSPPGRPIIGVAVAGFGNTNDERDFLGKLSKKRGHEQFRFKQCGDSTDFERWLRSEGYTPVQVLGLACQPVQGSMQSLPGGAAPCSTKGAVHNSWGSVLTDMGAAQAWNSATKLFGLTGGGRSAASRQERLLADVHMVVDEVRGIDKDNVEVLRAAKAKLRFAIQNAVAVDVAEEDLRDALDLEKELQRLISQLTRWHCFWCCHADSSSVLKNQDLNPAELGVQAQDDEVVTVMHKVGTKSQLPPGTRCRYKSMTRSGWVDGVVQRFNADDGTYDLDVRERAACEYITPHPSVSVAEAWPAGTLVRVVDGSTKRQQDAVILSFNAPSSGGSATYNLDVAERVAVDRILPRSPGALRNI